MFSRTLLTDFKENIVPERHPVYDRVARVANQILRGNRDFRQIYDKARIFFILICNVILLDSAY